MSNQEVNQGTERQPEGISISVRMKAGYLFSFQFQHLHRSFKGIFGVCLSVAALIAFAMSFGGTVDTGRRVILLIIGLLFTVVNPVMLFFKSYQQIKLSPIYKEPLNYTFSREGMKVSQGEEEQFVTWKQVLEVRKTRSILVIYTAKNAGSIIAFSEMGDQRQEIEMIIAQGCRAAGIKKIPAYLNRQAGDMQDG